MKEKYNVIIVDDEYLAQKLLQDYVSKVESLQLVATCSNAFEAMNALKNHQVDIMFLDIQMPDLTGLELVKSLEHKPAVIFTTAYSEYAVDAFNLSVVDYLLKPFDFPRFSPAVTSNGRNDSFGPPHFTEEAAVVKSGQLRWSDLWFGSRIIPSDSIAVGDTSRSSSYFSV